MSMIGVLIDNLNKSADEWNSSNMFELAHMCRDAADTIWQLRDDLQRANTEKAALERRIDELCAEVEKYRSARDASVDLATKTIDRINELEAEVEHGKAENAKLLRTLRALALCADDNADCDKCVMNGAVYSSVRQTFCNEMADELRAVGIEVDEC